MSLNEETITANSSEINLPLKTSSADKEHSTCNICGLNFLEKEDLTKHMRHVHFGISLYTCGACSETFEKQELILKHYKNCTGHRPLQHVESNEQVKDIITKKQKKDKTWQWGRRYSPEKNTYNVPKLRCRETMEKFKCTECGIKFSSAKAFKNHSQIHVKIAPKRRRSNRKEPIPGELLKSSTNDLEKTKSLSTRSVCKRQDEITCIFCDERCSKILYSLHLVECHTQNYPKPTKAGSVYCYKCLKCGFTSKYLPSVQKHLQFKDCPSYSDFSCSVCFYRLGNTPEHNEHMASRHYHCIYNRDDIYSTISLPNILSYIVAPNTCRFCASKYPPGRRQHNHTTTCPASVYKCTLKHSHLFKDPFAFSCNMKFPDFNSLTGHICKTMETGGSEFAYRCNLCKNFMVEEIPSTTNQKMFYPNCCLDEEKKSSLKCYCCGDDFEELSVLVEHVMRLFSGTDKNQKKSNHSQIKLKPPSKFVNIKQNNKFRRTKSTAKKFNKTGYKAKGMYHRLRSEPNQTPISQDVSCPNCSFVCKNRTEYLNHGCVLRGIVPNDMLSNVKEKSSKAINVPEFIWHGSACPECDLVFKNKFEFFNHPCVLNGLVPKGYINSYDAGKEIKCALCGIYVSSTVDNINYHKKKCPYCAIMLCGTAFIRNHMIKEHTFPCSRCRITLKTKSKFVLHMMGHESESSDETPCPICGKVVDSTWQIHVRIEHGDDALADILNPDNYFNCGWCSDKFLRPQALQTHIQSTHMEVYSCIACGDKFKSEKEHREHQIDICTMKQSNLI